MSIQRLEKAAKGEPYGKHLIRTAKRNVRNGMDEKGAVQKALKDLEDELETKSDELDEDE